MGLGCCFEWRVPDEIKFLIPIAASKDQSVKGWNARLIELDAQIDRSVLRNPVPSHTNHDLVDHDPVGGRIFCRVKLKGDAHVFGIELKGINTALEFLDQRSCEGSDVSQ